MSEATSLSQVLEQIERLSQIVAQQQATIERLEGQAVKSVALSGPVTTTTSSRRRLLRKLAGSLMAGVAVGGASLVTSSPVEARIISNPAGTNNQIGAIVVPPGKPTPTGTPTTDFGTYQYGLVGTDGSAFSLSTLGDNVRYGNMGLFGNASGFGSNGVYGNVSGPFSNGVYGNASSDSSYGVVGNASGTSSIGVYGVASGTSSYAGYFNGAVAVAGTLSKSSGSFKIDHPLDPANKYLYHSFVESPDMMNIYNGIALMDEQGHACIELPDWFEALNRDFRYQLTPIGQACPTLYVSHKVDKGCFHIAGGTPGLEVSWMLTGIRQDAYANAHRIQVEETKPDPEKGTYLHPELF